MVTLKGTLPSLLLGTLLTFTSGALGANPGLVVRITDQGLEYVAQEELLALQKKLHKVTLPNFDGDVRIKHFGSVDYGFHRYSNTTLGAEVGTFGGVKEGFLEGVAFHLSLQRIFRPEELML